MALDDYQKKLEGFISVVLLGPPGYMDRWGAQYRGVVESGTPVLQRGNWNKMTQAEKEAYRKLVDTASIKDNETFTRLTGLTHRQLLNNWKVGSNLTSCNGLVGKAVSMMGGRGLGRFNLKQALVEKGKSHCWIEPCEPWRGVYPRLGHAPRFGDVFETRVPRAPGQTYENLHVGVSLKVEGGMWHTIEGGKGGPNSGVDRVARIVKPYNVMHVLGWVDMKLFVSGTPAIPDWIVGTWQIYRSGKAKDLYIFDRYGQVNKFPPAPGLFGYKESSLLDTGELIHHHRDKVQVRWGKSGQTEEFTHDGEGGTFMMVRMKGVAADGTPMSGVRAEPPLP
jgi:hypothetical protein